MTFRRRRTYPIAMILAPALFFSIPQNHGKETRQGSVDVVKKAVILVPNKLTSEYYQGCFESWK